MTKVQRRTKTRSPRILQSTNSSRQGIAVSKNSVSSSSLNFSKTLTLSDDNFDGNEKSSGPHQARSSRRSIRSGGSGIRRREHSPLLNTSLFKTNKQISNVCYYPWNNNPIAVAFWIATKIVEVNGDLKTKDISSHEMVTSKYMTPTGGAKYEALADMDVSYKSLWDLDDSLNNTGFFQDYFSPEGTPRLEILVCKHGEEIMPGEAAQMATEQDGTLEPLLEVELERMESKLTSLQPHALEFENHHFKIKENKSFASRKVVAIGKLLLDVLAPLFDQGLTHPEWQARTNTLIKALDDKEKRPDCSFITMAFAALAENKEILSVVKPIVSHINSSPLLFTSEYGRINGVGEFQTEKFSPIHLTQQQYNNQQYNTNEPDQYISPLISHDEPVAFLPGFTPLSSHKPTTRSSHPIAFSPERDNSSSISSSFRSQISDTPLTSFEESQSPLIFDSKRHTSPFENRHSRHSFSNLEEMARTSGRIRKPTLRAQEADPSVFGKGGGKGKGKVRKKSPKPSVGKKGKEITPAPTLPAQSLPAPLLPPIPEIVVSDETGGKSELASTCHLSEEDQWAVNQLIELTRAAIAPDFKPEVEVDLDELRREFYAEMRSRMVKGKGKDEEVPELGRLADPSELEDPGMPRPYTDKDGFVHTGRVNEHGEEYVVAPSTYSWWRPADIPHGDMQNLRPPPPRLKSCSQIEKDNVFGFPPPVGQRNLPSHDTPATS